MLLKDYMGVVNKNEFIFCYSEEKPETLVMLKKPEKMPDLLFADSDIFVWVGGMKDHQVLKVKYQIESKLGITFYHYQTTQQAKKALEHSLHQNATLVINVQLFTEGKRLKHKIKQTFFYSSQPKSEFYQSLNEKQQKQFQLWDDYIFENAQAMADQLKFYQSKELKILPNFVFQSQNFETSQILVRTMHSLLNQRVDKQTENQINQKFKDLIEQFQKFDPKLNTQKTQLEKQSFFKSLRDGFNSDKQIVGWYSDETFVYKIINNLLRAQRNATQIFYIQPYFKKLFNVIQKLYKLQVEAMNKGGKPWNFTVYRGGRVDKEECIKFLNMKGGIIQNLGFLSTSLSKQKAESFKANIMFQISIAQFMVDGQFGFCSFEKWGMGRFGQQQVLFNPLNNFQIICAEQVGKGNYYIRLKYLNFSEDTYGDSSQNDPGLKVWRTIQSLQNIEKYQNQCEGCALTNEYYKSPEGDLYWDKYLEVNSKFNNYETLAQRLKLTEKQIHENALYFLREAYALWNQYYHTAIHEKERWIIKYVLTEPFTKIFKFFNSLSDHKESVVSKFKHLLQLYELEYEVGYQKNYKHQFLKDLVQEKFYGESQYKYFEFVNVNKFLHYRQQKQLITRTVQLSNMQLDDQSILTENMRKMLEGDLLKISLDRNQIKKFPSQIIEKNNLSELSFNLNNLKCIPQEISNLKKLTKLSINNNELTLLPIGIGQLKLRFVDLSNNFIQQLPQSIQNWTHLEELNLSYNQLKQVSQAFSKLINLKILILQSNQLTQLAESIFELINLKVLNISRNKIKEIGPGIGKLSHLEVFQLYKNQLVSMPEEISNLLSLKQLYLSNNCLVKPPSKVFSIQSLVSFEANNNLFNQPFQFECSLSKLQELNLNQSSIKNLSDNIQKLFQLKHLFLSKNRIQKLPQGLFSLVKLEIIDLSQNQITFISQRISCLLQLRRLYLSTNRLKFLPDDLSNLILLKGLQVAHNSLVGLPTGIVNLNDLEILQLGHNKLAKLPDEILNLSGLQTLSLQHNQLTQLPAGQFKLCKLKRLDISHNNIAKLPQSFLSSNSLEKLFISNNPISLEHFKNSVYVSFRLYLDISQYEKVVNIVGKSKVYVQCYEDESKLKKIYLNMAPKYF